MRRLFSIHALFVMLFLAAAPVPSRADWLVRTDTRRTLACMEQAGLKPVRQYRHFPWTVFRGSAGAEKAFERDFKSLGLIAEPVRTVRLARTPNDPAFVLQTDLQPVNADADIYLREAWDLQTWATVPVVAIIDTGISIDHLDLIDNFWTNQAEADGIPGVDDDGNGYIDDVHGWNAADNTSDIRDQDGHGTSVAGVIAGRGNNGLGIAGTCWTGRMMTVRAFADNEASNEAILSAMDYVLGFPEVRVINASWGDPEPDPALLEAIQTAGEQGIVFVAAAGNDAVNIDTTPFYPAAYSSVEPSIIAVGACSSTGAKASFSNYGRRVGVVAPGVLIYTTLFNQSYRVISGTSLSAPRVAGAAALMIAAHPHLAPDEVAALMSETSRTTTALSGYTWGGGLLNVRALLESVPSAAADWTMYP